MVQTEVRGLKRINTGFYHGRAGQFLGANEGMAINARWTSHGPDRARLPVDLIPSDGLNYCLLRRPRLEPAPLERPRLVLPPDRR